MLIFFDTEFTDLCEDRKLISIGLIATNGKSFYAELNGWHENEASEFVLEHVVPNLERSEGLPWAVVADSLTQWIEAFDEPVVLATDSLPWDWPWILQLCSERWPSNLHRSPEILVISEEFEQRCEKAFQTGLRRHHALDDAKANMIAAQNN